jgi:hypothetical protein
MDNQITVFVNDNSIVSFSDKKGNAHQLSAEGALFKGGAALRALKDVAMQAAFSKAEAGRYRSAADILCASFPSVGKAVDKVIGTPWASKTTMSTLITAVERADEPAKGWSKKQLEGRAFISALRTLPAFKADQVTINA